jgi:hypothetical protein
MRLAEQYLVRNLVGDAYQWRQEHLQRLRARLEGGDEFIDLAGPMSQPRLRRPDGTVYVLYREDS